MKLSKTQEQSILIASNPTGSHLPLNVNIEALRVLLVYGGISVATILAMTIFIHIFMDGLKKMLNSSSSNQQYKPKKRNNLLNSFLSWLNDRQNDHSDE